MADIIKVLLVDDKEDYCESLAGVARNNDFHVIFTLDWETGYEVLKEDPKIEFVILDGKGKIEADQGTEKENFAVRAMDDIKALAYEEKKHIPYCVNTGFVDSFGTLEGNVEIFEKNEHDRDRMFQYIKQEVEKSAYRTSKLLFPEPFKAFDKGIIDSRYRYLLLELIECHQKEDYRKKNITVQRDLLEAILRGLNNPIPTIPDIYFYENGQPDLAESIKFLEGRIPRDVSQRIQYNLPFDIRAAFRKLKESTNSFSHLKEDDAVKYPFLSNFYLLMEVLCWLPEFVDEHYEIYI